MHAASVDDVILIEHDLTGPKPRVSDSQFVQL